MKAFERDLRKAVEKAANDGMKKVGADIQRAFDRVHRMHGGKPVSNVRTALREEMRRSGFAPDQRQLDSWAKAISDGTHITVQVDNVRL